MYVIITNVCPNSSIVPSKSRAGQFHCPSVHIFRKSARSSIWRDHRSGMKRLRVFERQSGFRPQLRSKWIKYDEIICGKPPELVVESLNPAWAVFLCRWLIFYGRGYTMVYSYTYIYTTVDGCEILHHQKDGWKPNKIMGCLPSIRIYENWCRISQSSNIPSGKLT